MAFQPSSKASQGLFHPLISVLVLGLIAAVTSGCAGLGQQTHVSPSKIGSTMTLTELKDNVGKYMVYYAGLSADPTAILFVPKKGPSDLNLTLSDDWRQMRLYSDLRSLIGNLEYNEPAFTVKLRAVVPPKENPGPDDLLAYIYSKHRASLRQIEPGAYRLGDVIGASGGPGSGAIIPGRDRD